ncbi:copper resistance system multicopper oxidase [Euryhalocaulis caribicus]|uniref:copper resistance system multicopper oxidase n=1 Tax=Euryhalocaulis caribicus TaxID=1161401 RepID=UPI0003A28C78|nr:copper resistance system multicopper oxidase [Euryhalocaulis caribicus]
MFSRRQFLQSAAGGAAALGASQLVPAWARAASLQSGAQQAFDLTIAETPFELGGRRAVATTINGGIPGPLLRFQEGKDVTLRVTNRLADTSSLHWHGLLLPNDQDGVPGVTFDGIAPGETFTYRYPVRQSGTYWYHSHSRFQEQTGVYGPIIIDPAEPDPVAYDREYIVMLSDWSFEDPERIFAKLKKHSDYYNYNKRTVGDFLNDVRDKGLGQAISDRKMWAEMRMMRTDIADVTGATYTYLMNGTGPDANWTGLFNPGERVRLRFINGSAMSYFDVRIPGLPMTVVGTDGQNVSPVETDEFRISVAETYDVMVEPREDRAYTIFAESMDRSGYARGTLAPRAGMRAEVPALREPFLLTMQDMGMGGMSHGAMGGMAAAKPGEKMKSGMDHSGHDMSGMDHSGHDMGGMKMQEGAAGAGGGMAMDDMSGMDMMDAAHNHPGGPAVAMEAMNPQERLDDPGNGLGNDGWRVLTYSQLENLGPNKDPRPPAREVELHLTSNMERYMWSFDGVKFNEVDGPILFRYGERLRLTLVNDTMMAHPIHLHGMFVELETGAARRPLKHVVNVEPGTKRSMLITADEPGDWAFHCHLLYHMEAGMMRVVRVAEDVAPGHPGSHSKHGDHGEVL